MRVEAVDAFYLRMPQVLAVGDGSQDALLIRVVAGGFVGWGECEASPLTTMAALIAPMSHSACRPVLGSVLGATLNGPESILRIQQEVKRNGMDMLQTDHALSGIDIALWDALGQREKAPVWSLLGHVSKPQTAYASQLFGDTPAETFAAAQAVSRTSYRAAKFGWGPIGLGSLQDDLEHLAAAREGLGEDRILLVDTGCVFDHDVERALSRVEAFEEFNVGWWEEPFVSGALREYADLASRTGIPLAAGEGAHNVDQAVHLIDYGKVRFIQIDTGRIGGITTAREVARCAASKGVQYVNHTFTSNLALSASLQPYMEAGGYAEMPVQMSPLAQAIGGAPWVLDENGCIQAPGVPGLGVTPDLSKVQAYIQKVEILVNGLPLWPR